MSEQTQMQRFSMIESQLRTNGIDDDLLIAAYYASPREVFLPKALQNIAYRDEDIKLAGGRVMLEPMVEATMLKHANIGLDNIVAIMGAYPGNLAFVASKLASAVFAVEKNLQKADELRDKYDNLEAGNIIVSDSEPDDKVDVILFSAAVSSVPESCFKNLSIGGRLLAIIRKSENKPGTLTLFKKSSTGSIYSKSIREAYSPWLEGFEPKQSFVF